MIDFSFVKGCLAGLNNKSYLAAKADFCVEGKYKGGESGSVSNDDTCNTKLRRLESGPIWRKISRNRQVCKKLSSCVTFNEVTQSAFCPNFLKKLSQEIVSMNINLTHW